MAQVKTIQVIAQAHDPKCRLVVSFTESLSDKKILVVEKPAVSFRQEFTNDENGSKESLRVFIEKCDETC
jgi:hypothetical protein